MTRFNLFFSILLIHACSGFLTPKSPLVAAKRKGGSEQNVGSIITETEEDARFVLSQAKLCAYGECSISDAKVLLREILHVQSGCAAGTLVGHDVCEEQDVVADVVAHLREKVAQHERNDDVGNPV
jgi:hypothetical protein